MLSFENDKCWKRKTLPTLVTLACLSSLSVMLKKAVNSSSKTNRGDKLN